MNLYALKPWFVARLRRIEDALVARRVSPDMLSWAAVAVSLLAGAAVAAGGILDRPLLWLAVPPLGIVRLSLNALDGAVARRAGRARPFGAALNEATDRLSDAALLAPGAFVVGSALALGALVAAAWTSVAGVTTLALTGERATGGPMGKADRVAVVSLAALVAALVGSAAPLTAGYAIVLAGALVTAARRIHALKETGVDASSRR